MNEIVFTYIEQGSDTVVIGTDGEKTFRSIALFEEGPDAVEKTKELIEKVFSMDIRN